MRNFKQALIICKKFRKLRALNSSSSYYRGFDVTPLAVHAQERVMLL
jgi:hypothetical protein